MEFKGTKGKWVVVGGWDNDGKGCFPSVIIHGTEQNFKNNYGRNGITINVSHDQRAESLMANAQLIAHAPDMLEFIKSIFEDYENGLIDDVEHLAIRAELLYNKATTI